MVFVRFGGTDGQKVHFSAAEMREQILRRDDAASEDLDCEYKVKKRDLKEPV